MRGLIAVAVMVPFLLGACAQGPFSGSSTGEKQTGLLGGAAAGESAGSQAGSGAGEVIATGPGALAGALLGSEVGRSLDRADQAQLSAAFDKATTARIGQSVNWNNPESGNRGAVTPVREGHTNSGRLCREYKATVQVDGRSEEGIGTACQNPDGTWQLVS